MFSEILCPACSRKLRLPDEVIGHEVSCPSCAHTFAANIPASAPIVVSPRSVPPVPSLEPHRPEPEVERDAARRRPSQRREFRRDFAPCPACDKSVRLGAVACPHCGVDLEEQDDGRTRLPPMRRDAEPHRGGLIRLLGIGSLGCAFVYLIPIGLGLGIAAWTMGRRDLKKMRQGEMDRAGRGATHSGWVFGIAGTALNAVLSLGAVLILTLIIHDASRARTPPRPVFVPPGPIKPAAGMQFRNDPNDFTVIGPPGSICVAPGEMMQGEISVVRGPNFGGGDVILEARGQPRGLQVTFDPVAVRELDDDNVTLSVTATKELEPRTYWIEITGTSKGKQPKTTTVRVKVENP